MYESLINHVVLLERRLEIEKERPDVHHFELNPAYSAFEPRPCRMDCHKVFEWKYKLDKDYQPVYCSFSQDCVYATQTC